MFLLQIFIMKTSRNMYGVTTVVMTLILLFVNTTPTSASTDNIANCNNTSNNCDPLLEDDDAPCPPDSIFSDPSEVDSPCVCMPSRCVQPVCRYGSTRELRRTGTNVPGKCCDVYECVQRKEKNCSDVICPDEDIACPKDSYRLPNSRAPGDCCSHPQGCECLPGTSCPEPECVDGQFARMIRAGNKMPGTCCPLYECVDKEVNDTCILDGVEMKNGSTWWKNQCTECSCNNGVTFCAERSILCLEVPESCTETEIPPGECCPVCIDKDPKGCVSSSGKIQPNGAKWQEDACTTCICQDGTKKCQAYMCVLRCDRPQYVPTECCPLCDATSVLFLPPHCPALNNCSLRCLHGFVRDDDGCYICQCQSEECVLNCPKGYLQDNHGNKLCECAPTSHISVADCPALTSCHRNCSHGFRINKAGCEVCKCKECRQLTDCNKNCVHGLRTNDRGCQICKCKASGEQIPEVSTTNHIITETTCTSSDGLHHDDGEAWFDGCRQCYCHGGLEMCTLITCPVPICKDPFFNSSYDCCPHCQNSEFKEYKENKPQQPMVCHSVDGVYRVEGESWSLDLCTRCLCHLGRVLCETHHCLPAPCTKPIYRPGQCCPQCPNPTPILGQGLAESCGVHHPHGSTWMEDNCNSCVCVNGQTSCFAQQCHNVICSRPLLVKNQCCPMCLDQSFPKTCSVGNTTYHQDEEWHEDACTHCECSNGQKMCTEKVCSVSCTKPIKKPGKCCPVCPETDGTSHADTIPPSEVSSLGLFMESTYIIIILVLLCISICLALYIGHQCCHHRQQLKLSGISKSCPTPAYHGYSHRDSYPPPHYASGDHHRSKINPYEYKCVPSYDSRHINEMLKSPSIGSSEKTTLSTV